MPVNIPVQKQPLNAGISDPAKATKTPEDFQTALQNPEHPLRKMLNTLIAEGVAKEVMIKFLHQCWDETALMKDLANRADAENALLHHINHEKLLQQSNLPAGTTLPKPPEQIPLATLEKMLKDLTASIDKMVEKQTQIASTISELSNVIQQTEQSIAQKSVEVQEIMQKRADNVVVELQKPMQFTIDGNACDINLVLNDDRVKFVKGLFNPDTSYPQALQNNPDLANHSAENLVQGQINLAEAALRKAIYNWLPKEDQHLTENQEFRPQLESKLGRIMESIGLTKEYTEGLSHLLGLAKENQQNKSAMSNLESEKGRIDNDIKIAKAAETKLESEIEARLKYASENKSTSTR